MKCTAIHLTTALFIAIIFQWCGIAAAQPAPPNVGAEASADANAEVLTRGPLHEAFGSPIALDPVDSPLINKQPPEVIEELPPEHRPEGDSVVWIPGYWDWDREREDFIWISGLWRNAPPGRRWVPGYWNQADGGWRWIPGAWVRADVETMTYYEQPPASQERGPNSRAPSDDHFWVPGCWVHDGGRYKWRAGYWAPHQAGWVWVAAHYTPAARGYIFHDGYWDHRVSYRGQLFTPVYFRGRAQARFTPSIALTTGTNLLLHLFVDPNTRQYVFGDYYGDRYERAGYHPWFEYHRSNRGYDPFFAYYNWDYGRRNVNYLDRLLGWHKYYSGHPEFRPRATLTEQIAFAAAHEGQAHLDASLLARPLNELIGSVSGRGFVEVAADQRTSFATSAQQMLDLAGQRLQIESATRAATDGSVRLPTQPLELPELPGVRIPEVGRDVPDIPLNLLRDEQRQNSGEGRRVPRNVPVPELPVEPRLPRLPGLPF